jgi:hypothetical protein
VKRRQQRPEDDLGSRLEAELPERQCGIYSAQKSLSTKMPELPFLPTGFSTGAARGKDKPQSYKDCEYRSRQNPNDDTLHDDARYEIKVDTQCQRLQLLTGSRLPERSVRSFDPRISR